MQCSSKQLTYRCADNRAIIPAVWPEELGRAGSGRFDLQVRENWQYVPETFEGICDWALVTKDDDGEGGVWGRRHLLYRPIMLPEEARESSRVVVVVLQGFLGKFNISPLGNWDR